jgi:hypothetical protein
MTRATNEEFEAWKADCIANPAKLDSLPRSVAQMWRKQWGIDATVKSISSARSLNKGVGVSIQIDENSNIDQVIDFAFRLQMMLNSGAIAQDGWKLGTESIQRWLTSNQMTWAQFLSTMKEQVAS